MKTLGDQLYYCPVGKHEWTNKEWSEKEERITLVCDEHTPKETSFSVPYLPPWKRHESGIWSENTKESMKSTDRFLAEREHEIRNDPKAARWEKSRKERLAKNKPAWVKEQQRKGIL